MREDKIGSLDKLQSLVYATCLRRTKASLSSSFQLLDRLEKIETVDMSAANRELYDFFSKRAAEVVAYVHHKPRGRRAATASRRDTGRNILPLIHFLRLICNHGEEVLPEAALNAWKNRIERNINWEMMSRHWNACDLCQGDIDSTDNLDGDLNCGHSLCGSCLDRGDGKDREDEEYCPKCDLVLDVDQERRGGLGSNTYRPSAKVEALLKNIEAEQRTNTTAEVKTDQPIKR